MAEMREGTQKKESRKMKKDDKYACEVCGLQVYVDVCGEEIGSSTLFCCEQPMERQEEEVRTPG